MHPIRYLAAAILIVATPTVAAAQSEPEPCLAHADPECGIPQDYVTDEGVACWAQDPRPECQPDTEQPDVDAEVTVPEAPVAVPVTAEPRVAG